MGKQPPQSNLPKLRPFVTDTVTAKEAVARVRFSFTYIFFMKNLPISEKKMEIPFTNTSTLILYPNEWGNSIYIQDNLEKKLRLIAYYLTNKGWVVCQKQTFEYIRTRHHKEFAKSNALYREARNMLCIEGAFADFSKN